MNNSHLIKSNNSFLLGWFVFASVLAHFVFFAQNNDEVDEHVELSFSAPLSITVISTRSDTKPQTPPPSSETSPDTTVNKPNTGIENPDPMILSSNRKLSSKNRRPIKKNSFSQSDEDSKKELNLPQPATIKATNATEPELNDKHHNHLQKKLRQAIRARFTYPRIARRMNWEGLVGISLHIEEDGTLRDIQISRTSGHKVLDENARKTIEKIGRLQLADSTTFDSAGTEIEILYQLTD